MHRYEHWVHLTTRSPCTLCLWRKTEPLFLKKVLQIGQGKDFSTCTLLIWRLTQIFVENFRLQTSHVIAFESCSTMWFFSPLSNWKHFSHILQRNDLRYLWMLWCFTRLVTWANSAGHHLHLYGFSPVWVRSCVTKFGIENYIPRYTIFTDFLTNS